MKFDKILPGREQFALDGDPSARQRLDAFAELTSDILWETGADHCLVYLSSNYEAAADIKPSRAVGKRLWDLSGTNAEADNAWQSVIEAMDAHEPFPGTRVPYHHKSGADYFVKLTGKPFFDSAGQFQGYRGTSRNVTKQEETEEELRRSQERLLRAHRIAKISHWETDISTLRSKTFGNVVSSAGLIGEVSEEEVLASMHPDDIERVSLFVGRCEQEGMPFNEIYRKQEDDGSVTYIRAIGEAVYDDEGNIVKTRGTLQDVTDQVHNEQELRRSEERYTLAARYGRMAVWEVFPKEGKIISDANMKALMGLPDDAPALTISDLAATVHEDDLEHVSQALSDVLEGRSDHFSIEHRTRKADGTVSWLRDQGYVASKPSEPMRIVGTTLDVSEQKEAEEQLQQAQKMEAVGQLTGGVAHDFNNLLAIINGNLELLEEELTLDERNTKMISSALNASRRGAELTKRLLAFSRRQALAPQATDLNALTSGMLDLARRTLGEAVEVTFDPAEDIWQAQIDPGQLENALLNLGINARDAMPDGGTLTFITRNVTITEASDDPDAVTPGDYAVVEVSDTGTGMAPELLEKIFEPFFTTKEVGQGTGLGLSMVYGFVKQSDGHINIDSTVGKGTTVSLYLPRAAQSDATQHDGSESPEESQAAGETILVVEDDPDVRELVVALLKNLGYAVLESENAEMGLEIIESGRDIDLLFSDVVLGKGTNGAELAKIAWKRRPELKILLMSGYTSESAAEEIRELDFEFIDKPFTKAELAKRLGKLLRPRQDVPSASTE